MASGAVLNPHDFVDPPVKGDKGYQGPINKDFFENFKSQSWWRTRKMFYNAWRCREGLDYDHDNVISINPNMGLDKILALAAELSQPIRKESKRGKMMVDKSPNGSRSPNAADSVIIAINIPFQNQIVSEGA